MARAFCVSVCVGMALLLIPAAAVEPAKTGRSGWVWHPTEDCPVKPEEGTPGSSPDTAITFEHFFNLMAFALYEAKSEMAIGVEGDQKHFPPNCKWVRLTGFFSGFGSSFRGALWENAKGFYFQPRPRYLIETFANPSMRSGDLHHRRITVVGRFHDVCADSEQGDNATETEDGTGGEGAETGDETIIVGVDGLCSWGDDSGMVLSDVFMEKVHDEAPRFLTGEQNRNVIRELAPYTAEDLETLVETTRAWAALVKSGAEVFVRKTIGTDPEYARRGAEYTERFRKFVTDPDSYISYLGHLAAFRRLNTKTAQVAIFRNQFYVEHMRDNESVGCICMIDDCTNLWPVLDRDADDFLGAAVCTPLRRSAEDPVWRW